MGAYSGLAAQIRPTNRQIFVPAYANSIGESAHWAPAFDSTNNIEVMQLAASLTDTLLTQLPFNFFRSANSPGATQAGASLSTITARPQVNQTYGDSLRSVDVIYSIVGAAPTSMSLTAKGYSFGAGGTSQLPTTTVIGATGLPLTVASAGHYVRNNVIFSQSGLLIGSGALFALSLAVVTPAGSVVNVAGYILNLNNE